jgi:hypothetical protein
LCQAFESGQLSLHALERLSNELTPRQQDQWLKKELKRRHQKSEGEHLAAVAIAGLLNTSAGNEKSIHLGELSAAIRDAVAWRAKHFGLPRLRPKVSNQARSARAY